MIKLIDITFGKFLLSCLSTLSPYDLNLSELKDRMAYVADIRFI